MIEFRIAEHTEIPGKKVVELYSAGKLVGCLYENESNLMLYSKYFAAAHVNGNVGKSADDRIVASVVIGFDLP